MLINPQQIIYQHYNERDIEIPALLFSVERYSKDIQSLLDVGYNLSWSYYAPSIRKLMTNKIYDGIDILPDPYTEKILDHYFTGNVCETGLELYDYVACVSTIEHCGLRPYLKQDYRAEQIQVFQRLLKLSNKFLFLSFPIGLDHIFVNEYANITDDLLNQFEYLASIQQFVVSDIQFCFNEFPQGREKWNNISRQDAVNKPMIKEKGCQCVCLVEFTKE